MPYLLKFPSLLKAISPIVKERHLNYLNRNIQMNIQEFIDTTGDIASTTWSQEFRKTFGQGDIFARGTGVSALYILLFWLQHVANSFNVPLENYLRQVWRLFPYRDWRIGGFLAGPKGAGAGKQIANIILRERLDLPEEKFPQKRMYEYLERHEFNLLGKLKPLLLPSNWLPFVTQFINTEYPKSGVYIIVGLNRQLEKIKIRTGQAENLKRRLQIHLRNVQQEFPSSITPLFYCCAKMGRRLLDKAEQALFHLIPRDIRLPNIRHPRPCRLCNRGFE